MLSVDKLRTINSSMQERSKEQNGKRETNRTAPRGVGRSKVRFGVEAAEADREGLQQGKRPLHVHVEAILAHLAHAQRTCAQVTSRVMPCYGHAEAIGSRWASGYVLLV